jgi:hypothetical protein
MSDPPEGMTTEELLQRARASARRALEQCEESARIIDDARKMRGEPRPRHLHLVPPLEEDDDG